MDIFLQIVISGLTVGAMYAAGTIALSLLWNSMGMLNLANGAFIAIGGYAAYWCITVLHASWIFALPVAAAAGLISGYIFYHLLVRWMYQRADFQINIIIATVAVAALVENGILNIAGPEAVRQPFQIAGGLPIGGVILPYQTLATFAVVIILLIVILWILTRTRLGLKIRAVSQQKEAAQLMGVHVSQTFGAAMMLAATVSRRRI
jgi:branched-subunit amino acid ABC-type transport system permease component